MDAASALMVKLISYHIQVGRSLLQCVVFKFINKAKAQMTTWSVVKMKIYISITDLYMASQLYVSIILYCILVYI